MPTARTPWECFDAFPPPYCRLFAKEPGGGTHDMSLTDTELAIRANLPLARIRQITQQETWDGIPVGEMRAFFQACNFDPTNAAHRHRVDQYENICKKRKSIPFHYLRLSPKWESEFRPLLLIVVRIMKSHQDLSHKTSVSVSPAKS